MKNLEHFLTSFITMLLCTFISKSCNTEIPKEIIIESVEYTNANTYGYFTVYRSDYYFTFQEKVYPGDTIQYIIKPKK